jgi:hypothetical protein
MFGIFHPVLNLPLELFGKAHIAASPRHRSSSKRNPPLQGDVRLSDRSGLRKLMRASRRGLLPPERLRIIRQAEESAAERRSKYMSRAARQRDRLYELLSLRGGFLTANEVRARHGMLPVASGNALAI